MSISFEGPAVMVRDMAACRAFYENLLEQTPLFCVGQAYTAYAGKFSLWEAGGAAAMIFGAGEPPAAGSLDAAFELYFETEAVEQARDRLRAAGVVFIHDIREQPWRQRCLRVRDPEGRIVEIGEPLAAVARRLLAEGQSPEEVSRQTMLPLEMVASIASGTGA